jgi:polar amino acid transport system substrate-binding protein
MWRVIALLFGLLASPPAWPEKIIAACDPYPPYVDPTQATQGLSVQIVRAAYATQGFNVEMQFIPWARAIEGVRKGMYDILPDAWWTQDRATFLLFSEPYISNEIKFIKRKGDPFEYTGLGSLTGKTVGIVRAYGYSDDFLKATNFTREEVPTAVQNIRKLVRGRIDLTLEDEIVVRSLLKQEAPDLLRQIEFTHNLLSSQKLYVASSLQNPRRHTIITAFNKGLAVIKANGTYDAILHANGLK